ncbi:hypothetical protein EDM80_14970 [bacterium]|nr:MAG: hypothetical protein EDM80_14970 [bacterium]RIK63362.1 MAG: hypothetical protein DCC64_07340 [Planctomycetota bacterium]
MGKAAHDAGVPLRGIETEQGLALWCGGDAGAEIEQCFLTFLALEDAQVFVGSPVRWLCHDLPPAERPDSMFILRHRRKRLVAPFAGRKWGSSQRSCAGA